MKGNEQIVVEYLLPEPPSKVWRALTEPKLLARWLMENDIAPVVGHDFTFRARPQGNWDGMVYCKVLEVEPEKRLVYEWNGGSKDNPDYGHLLESTVTWTLQPSPDGGTLLKLVHHGFQPDDFGFHAMSQGWKGKGAAISSALSELG
jgi:uncharacterized protein YndB with AHSA1/START domain